MLGSVREFKKPTILTLLLIIGEVFIEVLARVFPVDLQERGGSALFSPKELCA